MKTTIEISARHLHLTKEDFHTLFGTEEITKRNNLSQKGEYAGEETVEIVGTRGRILEARVIGPIREYSQVEISKTDSINIGIVAPYRESGTGGGTKVKLVGPKGEIMEDIAIVPMRHLHISTANALSARIKNGDAVSVLIQGERSVELKNIVVRVSDDFYNHIHLDTDDANSAGIENNHKVEFVKQK